MHLHTKFCDPSYNNYGDVNLYPVNFGQVNYCQLLCISRGGLKDTEYLTPGFTPDENWQQYEGQNGKETITRIII